jgi:hypothetical protein
MTDKIVHCKNCVHRDPEDKKCECGALERAGCIFPVADDYYCAYGEVRKHTMKLVIEIEESSYLAYKELIERSLLNGEYVRPLEHIIAAGVPLQDFLKEAHNDTC